MFPFILFCFVLWLNTTQVLWTFDYYTVAWLLNRNILPLSLSEYFIYWMNRSVCSLSSYFNQVYNDDRRWISRYQTLWKRDTYVGIDIAKLNYFVSDISFDGIELMKPFKFTNKDNSFQLLNSRLIDFLLETIATSVLNQLHTTVTMLSDTLLLVIAMCVESHQDIGHANW